MLGAYIQGNWSQTTSGCFEASRLYACRHVNAVISWVNDRVIPDSRRPEDFCPTYAEDIASLLSEYLVNPPEPCTPGDWILTDVIHPFKGGHLVFYLSEYEGVYVFCRTQSISGRNYLYCFLCPRSRGCSHTTLTTGCTNEDELPHLEQNSGRTEHDTPIPTELLDELISKQRYPFDLDGDPELREIIHNRTFNTLSDWYQTTVPGGVLKAEKSRCCDVDCDYIKAKTQSNYTEMFSLHGYALLEPIQSSVCRICHTRYDFDGRSLGLLNYGNRFLFTVELILDLLEFKAISGTPTYSYWQARSNTMLKAWTREETAAMKKSWMNMSGRVNGIMTAYLSLVDYPSNHFQCCKDPEVVCIDGIVLSVESRRINTTTPWVDSHALRTRFTKKEDRSIVVLSAQQKQILKDFIRIGTQLEDLELLASEIGSPVGDFILCNIISDRRNPQVLQCPPLLKRFYQSLYKWISPACSIAPSSTWDMLKKIVILEQIPFNYIARATELSPVLRDILSYITTTVGHHRKYNSGIQLLAQILLKAKGCYSPVVEPRGGYKNPIRPVNENERVLFTSPSQEVIATGAYFPGRPYHSVVQDIYLNNEAAACNKLYKKQGRLGAGTLLFWCGVHRKCLGFYIMKSAESCKTVFQILATRFPKQPRVIIYDNGCNLSEYILNRAPGPFKDSYILSDGFHWKNHTNCGVSFNSKLYPALDSTYY